MKFLVMWNLDLSLLGASMVNAVMRMPEFSRDISARGKLVFRYHLVGKHGGAWLLEVDSNEELERLLASSPVYNFARFSIHPLADMETPTEVVQSLES